MRSRLCPSVSHHHSVAIIEGHEASVSSSFLKDVQPFLRTVFVKFNVACFVTCYDWFFRLRGNDVFTGTASSIIQYGSDPQLTIYEYSSLNSPSVNARFCTGVA